MMLVIVLQGNKSLKAALNSTVRDGKTIDCQFGRVSLRYGTFDYNFAYQRNGGVSEID